MKIGTMIKFNSSGQSNVTIDDIERKFRELSENGFDNCQFCSWLPSVWTDENAEKINGFVKKYGVEISAFWCGWEGPNTWNFYDGQYTLGLVAPEYRAMRVKNLCDGADFAKKLGVTDVVTHMGFIPENPNDSNFMPMCIAIRTVAKHLEANGQNLLFETGQETPVTMLRCFETVGCDNLFVNLDTANLILYGKANPVDSLDVYGKYVRGIHAKDGHYPTNGHDLGREVKIGEGRVDFKALFIRLHELGYDGCVTIEREVSSAAEENRDVLEARDYLRKIIDEVYGGGKCLK